MPTGRFSGRSATSGNAAGTATVSASAPIKPTSWRMAAVTGTSGTTSAPTWAHAVLQDQNAAIGQPFGDVGK